MQSDMRNLRKERHGIVSSNKMDKTITVAIKWKEKHPNEHTPSSFSFYP